MWTRRLFLSVPAAALVAPQVAVSQQKRSLADPLRVGVDLALAESGLGKAIQRSFGRDTGIAVTLVPGPALRLLEDVERGEIDALICNAPEQEARLEQQSLVHERRLLATGSFVLVGPAPRGKQPDPAGIAGTRDAAAALQRIRAAAIAAPGSVSFLSIDDGSGTQVAEQALWRAARIAPYAPWYVLGNGSRGLIAQARERGAYALVERGAWGALGGGPLTVLVEPEPALAAPVHVMRAFSGKHPAGKIFVAWAGGANGRRVATSQRGYR